MRERGIIMQAESVLGIQAGRKWMTRRLVDMGRLRATLRADVPYGRPGLPEQGTLEARYTHGIDLNQHGAVFTRPSTITTVGLKPGEFDLLCPYAEGETRLADMGGGRKVWTIVPKASRLWVKETWYDDMPDDAPGERARDEDGNVEGVDYRATHRCTNYEAGCPCNTDGDGKRSAWRSSMFMPRWASRLLLDVTDVRLERLHDITEADAMAEGLQVEHLSGADRGRRSYAHLWDILNYARAPWATNPFCWAITFRRVDIARPVARAVHEASP